MMMDKDKHIKSPKAGLLGSELYGAFSRMDLAFHIAWTDTKARYRRSVLGPFWLVLGTIIAVGGLGFVWGTLFDVDRSVFIPSLSIGLITWYFLSAVITEGASVFYTNRDLILDLPVSSILVSFLLLMRQLINYFHNFVLVAVVLFIYPQHINWNVLWFFPGLFLVSFALLGLIQVLGYSGARYRDLSPLLTAVMQPIFFVTPVMFRPAQLGVNSFIVEFNPLTYFLALVRDPLMGVAPSVLNWTVVTGLTVMVWSIALFLTAAKRHRLPYWVS